MVIAVQDAMVFHSLSLRLQAWEYTRKNIQGRVYVLEKLPSLN